MGHVEECKLPVDVLESVIPVEAFLTGYSDTRRLVLHEFAGNKLSDELIRNEADNHCDRKRDCSKDEAYPPLFAIETDCGQSPSTNSYNNHLSTNGDEVNDNKEPVSVKAFEDVEFVIETTVADEA
jgi:hypothetical protein